jgi:putative membrane protein
MKLLAWLIGLPMAVVTVVFAVANRQDIRFDLWPLPFGLEVPAYMAVLIPLAVGLLTGALLVWLSLAPARLRAMRDRRRLDCLTASKPTQAQTIQD